MRLTGLLRVAALDPLAAALTSADVDVEPDDLRLIFGISVWNCCWTSTSATSPPHSGQVQGSDATRRSSTRFGNSRCPAEPWSLLSFGPASSGSSSAHLSRAAPPATCLTDAHSRRRPGAWISSRRGRRGAFEAPRSPRAVSRPPPRDRRAPGLTTPRIMFEHFPKSAVRSGIRSIGKPAKQVHFGISGDA